MSNRLTFMERLSERLTALEAIIRKLEPVESFLERVELLEKNIYATKKVFRWVLSIPFFISCIRQQNPLTVLSKIILRKVKQFNLPPPKKK